MHSPAALPAPAHPPRATTPPRGRCDTGPTHPETEAHARALSPVQRFLHWWWVVPRVQTDLADLDYQLYTFEVFHQDWRNKAIHYLTIPAIAFFCMVWASCWSLPGLPWLNGGLLYVALVAAVHARWSWRPGLRTLWATTTVSLALLWPVATVWAMVGAAEDPTLLAPTHLSMNPLLWIYAFAFLETLGHAFEPVPPHSSGSDRFVEMPDFWARGGLWRFLAIPAMPTFFTVTSLVSNLHLYPTFVMRLLASSDHPYREQVEGVRHLAKEQWATGQPPIHQVPPG